MGTLARLAVGICALASSAVGGQDSLPVIDAEIVALEQALLQTERALLEKRSARAATLAAIPQLRALQATGEGESCDDSCASANNGMCEEDRLHAPCDPDGCTCARSTDGSDCMQYREAAGRSCSLASVPAPPPPPPAPPVSHGETPAPPPREPGGETPAPGPPHGETPAPGPEHGDSPAPEPEHGVVHTGEEDAHVGGHTTDVWRTEACKPVSCGPDLVFEHRRAGKDTSIEELMTPGCMNYSVFNFMKQDYEQLYLTCEGCVPHTCATGEHDCVPVYCQGNEGEREGGGDVDAMKGKFCEGGHHDDDGLAWWPFLLTCLITTVAVTTILDKLSSGACFGKTLNPPFTVVMFFFGYYISHLCSEDGHDTSGHDAHGGHGGESEHHGGLGDVLFKSVVAWKGAHPHVILFVLLPPLLFEDASGMDYYVFRKVLMSSIILAGPGVLASMLLTAGTTMVLFGFAEECVVETDVVTGALMVDGARENTINGPTPDGEYDLLDPSKPPGMKLCDPWENPDWATQTGPDVPGTEGGLICVECVEYSWKTEQLPIPVHLLLGGMLAATDPVAVCAVLNDLGCPDKLNYLIAGESLLNDGTAVVAFMVMQSVAGGCDTDAIGVLITASRLAGGGVVWGLAMAGLCYEFIKHLRDPNIEITTLVFATLSTFWLAENILGVSGVLGTVVFGVQTARTSFLAMDERTHHANHAFWGEVGYVATSFIFILAGVKSRDKIASFIDNFQEDFADDKDAICIPIEDEYVCLTHHVCRWDMTIETGGECSANEVDPAEEKFHVGNQLILNFVLWIILGFIRAGVVLAFSPFLTRMGYGLTFKEAVVMVWGGLRGAVSLSLALLIDGNHLIGDRAREMIFLQTTGIVALTLVINGTTSGMVYKKLQVYPPNPYRPALASQSLRTIQDEMDKFIHKLRGHWFHSNVDMDVLVQLMPDFSTATMEDGDLVGMESMEAMQKIWDEIMEDKLVPTSIAGPSAADCDDEMLSVRSSAAENQVNILELCGGGVDPRASRVSRASRASVASDSGVMAPNPYGRISLAIGEETQTFETPVAKKTYTPTWSAGTASNEFTVPEVSKQDSVWLEVAVFDSDFGETDEKIGDCWVDLSALCLAGGDMEDSFELMGTQPAGDTPHTASPRCVGTVDLIMSCFLSDNGRGGELNVDMRNAVLYSQAQLSAQAESEGDEHGSRKVKRSASVDSEGGHGKGHGHGHDKGHGHGGGDHGGHGPSHVDKLRNIKRWLTASDSNVDHSFAMYDIMLAAMRSNFLHECEEKSISVKAYTELSAAIGQAIDRNEAQLDNQMAAGEIGLDDESRGSRMTRMARDGVRESPIDALEEFMMKYAEKGSRKKEATKLFTHHLLCTEMFLVLIEQLSELADNPDVASELGGFSVNAIKCCNRLKRKLAEMQVARPNTMRICHTLVAFNVVASQFTHRVHAYLEQGFVAEDMADAAHHIMLGRQRELRQHFAYSPLVAVLLQAIPRTGPVFFAYESDSVPPTPAAPSAADEDDRFRQSNGSSNPNGHSVAATGGDAGQPAVAETANPVAIDFLRERRMARLAEGAEEDPGELGSPQPQPVMQQQVPPSAVQMLTARRDNQLAQPGPAAPQGGVDDGFGDGTDL